MEEVQEAFDWRQHDVLTPVRQQGKCNCCWAIVAAGAIEAIYNIKYRQVGQNLLQLAPQYLIDCIKPDQRTEECYTFSTSNAFMWIVDHGIAEEKDYPFTAKRGVCRLIEKKISILSFKRITIENLHLMVQQQPIAGAIRITKELRSLKDEIYHGPLNPDDLLEDFMHAVLVVGFGKDNDGTKYWIIKNSWGEEWGDNGYGKIGQNIVNTREGPRYLLTRFSYPEIGEKEESEN